MNIALIATILIGAAALLGAWRTWRAGTARRGLRITLQVVAAVLIYLALFPPRIDERFAAGTLVVLTPGATEEQVSERPGGIATVALPGAVAPRDAEPVPDLGTALRRHPDTARLHVIGSGLPPRDLDAARTLPVEFDATPLPRGIVDVSLPSAIRAGNAFTIAGRVHDVAGGTIELRDPSDAVVARAALPDDGRFALAAQARSAGNAVFTLRVLDAGGATVEDVPQPIAVRPGERLRLIVLAGAPDPELKYLRRWAADAGLELSSRTVLSDGVAMTDGNAALTAEALAGTDLVVIDERAWKTLDANGKDTLKNATRSGLGLFLRVTGEVPDDVAADWRALGFRVRAADVPQSVTLESDFALPAAATTLTRRALMVEADDAAPLLRADDGSALALWRGEGQGCVAIWWLADTYTIALAGDGAAFGTLWSRALATVARARADAEPTLPAESRVDRRSVLCGIPDDAIVEQPDGTHAALTVETDRSGHRCAAYWPVQPGWHALVAGERRWAFYASDAHAARALDLARHAEATNALAGGSVDSLTSATRKVPAPRWPFYVAWLVAAGALWWLERTRARSQEI
jgi:hypothetical protein